MATFHDPSPSERATLETLAGEIPGIQQTLVKNHDKLTEPDRGAHQMQVAGSTVRLTVAGALPAELDGLGLFERGRTHVGIGRISTGLGCPHAETDPDFLGLMVAFRTAAGHRVDFVTINDPTSPTDTPEEFVALLHATADAAGASGLFASEARLLLSLGQHAGVLQAPAIALHVMNQTMRTVRSTSAYQQYWTGIVRARTVLGKFTFVPASPASAESNSRSATHLTDDWRARQSHGPLSFGLYWIPFVSDRDTPLADLTTPWTDRQKVEVGTVVFPQIDPGSLDARLTAMLAQEMGANPGNWVETDGAQPALPATRFTAARFLVYRASQASRRALADDAYASFFERGEIDADLRRELVRRYLEKRASGHWVPGIDALAMSDV